MKKYEEGDQLGINGHVLLERIPGTKKAKFLCGICKEGTFISNISDVTRKDNRAIQSCGCLKNKAKIGNRYGENQHLLINIRQNPDGRKIGTFACGLCGNKFQARIDVVKNNNKQSCGCLQDLCGKKYGKLIVLEETCHRDSRGAKKWLCRCDCDNIVEVSTTYLHSSPYPSCGCINSHGEAKIKSILSNLNIQFFQHFYFIDCKNNKTNCYLYFDFYLPDYNCCIEYDGIQHFEKTNFSHDDFEERKARDFLKNKYCEEKHIKMIRIPYIDYDTLNNDYLLQKIQSTGA